MNDQRTPNALLDRIVMKTLGQSDLLIQKLVEKLQDADPIIRRNATGALRLQGHRAAPALPAISSLLNDQDPRVRREAERTIESLQMCPAY
jgi:HEAT repeat protein